MNSVSNSAANISIFVNVAFFFLFEHFYNNLELETSYEAKIINYSSISLVSSNSNVSSNDDELLELLNYAYESNKHLLSLISILRALNLSFNDLYELLSYMEHYNVENFE